MQFLVHSCVFETSTSTLNSFSDTSVLLVFIKERFVVCPSSLLSHVLCVSLWCFVHQSEWICPSVLTHLFPTLFCVTEPFFRVLSERS